MKISENIYNLIMSFRREVIGKSAELDEREQAIEDLKGSARYLQIKAQLDEERKQIVYNARQRIGAEIDNLVSQADEKASAAVTMSAPSEEALRQLQLLKMKIDMNPMNPGITAEELKASITMMGDNQTAISMLKDIADKSNVILTGLPKPKGMTSGKAHEVTKMLAKSLATYTNLPKLDNRNNYADMMSKAQDDITNGKAVDAWRLDRNYQNARDMIGTMGYVDGAALDEYLNIIDSE